MEAHAKFAPSGAHRWIECPGSIRLSENIESTTSVYAMEGTALHKVTEQCLRDKIPATQFVGMKLDSLKDDPDWSMEMDENHAELVQYCVDEVRAIMTDYNIVGGKLEVVVKLTEDCWGTVDVLIWTKEWVIVIDFKFGQTPVEAEGNAQLMIYYLGALKYLMQEGIGVPPKAKLIILQPRLPNPRREWDTRMEEIKTWYIKSVKPAFKMVENGDAPCNPGEAQCKFCDANGVCASRADYLLGIAEEEFRPFVTEESEVPMVPDVKPLTSDLRTRVEASLSAGLELMTPEIAGKILEYQTDFDNFFKSVGKYALQQALNGTKIPGFKLVYGKSNRKWEKPDSEIEKILKDEFEVKEPFNKKTLSPAQAEKKVGKRKKELADYIFKPKGKTVLVDEADTREEIDLTGEADMEEFATETVTSNTQGDFEAADSIDDIMAGFDGPNEQVSKEVTENDEILVGANPVSPSNRTKKFKLMELGLKGGVSIEDVAASLFKGDEGQVKRGLRNLNERDGFTVIFHSDNTFTVKE